MVYGEINIVLRVSMCGAVAAARQGWGRKTQHPFQVCSGTKAHGRGSQQGQTQSFSFFPLGAYCLLQFLRRRVTSHMLSTLIASDTLGHGYYKPPSSSPATFTEAPAVAKQQPPIPLPHT